MPYINKVVLMGNITADPELKQTQSGQSVTTFGLAVNRRYQKDGNTECDFINCVAWKERAEFVSRYFKKGSSIIVCGSIQTRSYTTQTGERRTAFEVLADEVSFGANKSDDKAATPMMPIPGTTAQIPTAYGGNGTQFEEIADDKDLPF